ncbi:MAG: fibronectin type III domain-containing protein [Bacteroidetes bacterium]|nr:fibronectin type III domain-containing protein [Bacteroidota bacterium]
MKRILLLLVLFASSCQVNEADAPEVVTTDPQEIGRTSAVIWADLREVGPVRPVNYGFLWDTQSNLNTLIAKSNFVIGSTSDKKTFSIKIENLTPATTYYYRGFAANADYSKIYYGNIVTVTTLP